MASLRIKKVVSQPSSNHFMPERQDDVVVPHEINMVTLPLLIYRSASQEGANTDDRDFEEEIQGLIKEGPVGLLLLKSFKMHIAFFIKKDKVINYYLKPFTNVSLCICYY